jgi:lysophospholipase L1-like esterase
VRVGSAWMQPKLVAAGVPQHLWVPISDYLIEHMARLLRGLDLVDFHVVNTLGTIQRAAPGATGSSGEWDNEIHPSRRGYAKLAAKMSAAIREELGLP